MATGQGAGRQDRFRTKGVAMTYRIICPLCKNPLTYSQMVTEYGYLEKYSDGEIQKEWNDTIVEGDLKVFCETKDCTFTLSDFTDLESEISKHLG